MNQKNNPESSNTTRRQFARMTLGVLSIAVSGVALPRPARADHHAAGEQGTPELVTDFETNKLLLSQTQYVAISVQDGKQCANCVLLLQREGDYGRCGLFQQGQVPVTAYCTSWIKKPGT